MIESSENDNNRISKNVQHIFIIGAKSIGQYGGFETFVDRLIDEHKNDTSIKYHVACKANGEGCMDERLLDNVKYLQTENKRITEFEYHNAHVFKIPCPNIGPGVAVFYDLVATNYCIKYCINNHIHKPVFYILTCRIGLFIHGLNRKIKHIGGRYYLNPDGHEWKRTKWSWVVRKYWKWSEKKMVTSADKVICDSKEIEKYIKAEYGHPNSTYIAYGADTTKSNQDREDSELIRWMNINGLKKKQFYLMVGRLVPENNYETVIREFMSTDTSKSLVIIANNDNTFKEKLNKILGYHEDRRIRFVGTVYNNTLLRMIRENAYGYIHGHEVGGTNPSLLEALGNTEINLLFEVSFNKEVAGDSALYWSKSEGDLASLINKAEQMTEDERKSYGNAAKKRIEDNYIWCDICKKYKNLWTESIEGYDIS